MTKQVEHILEFIDSLSPAELRKLVEDLPVSDLFTDWVALDDSMKIRLFLLLHNEKKLDLLESLSLHDQEWLIETLSGEHVRLLLNSMEPDDLADFIQNVSPEIRQAVWQNLSEEAKKEALFLLRFEEDDAAGIMTPRYVAVRSALTVAQALNFIRKTAREVETIYYIYVIDQLKRIIGVLSLRDILFAEEESKIETIMEKKVITVREDTDQEEVAKVLEDHDLIAIPVVDTYNRLLGIVTVDDVIDVIRAEQTEDVYKMGGMEGTADRYLETSIWKLVKKRTPWLVVLLLFGTITTNVIHHYEPVLLGAAFLIIFLPIITQTGGNTGNQSSTLMIRGLATGDVRFRDIGPIFFKEIAVGVTMGIATGLVIFLRSYYLPPGVEMMEAMTIGLALVFVVVFAALSGVLAPLIIHKLGFDPTVMSAPLMATIIDVCGLTIYFETAKLLLRV